MRQHILLGSASMLTLMVAVPVSAQVSQAVPAPASTDSRNNPAPAEAVTTPTGDAPIEVAPVVVRTRNDVGHLDQREGTGSRLGLTPRETPAAINTIDAATILQRGNVTVEDAVAGMPGVTTGGSPGDPASFSMRGFINDQITILRDGIYFGPSNIVNRPENTYNLQDIEVLKGPASVLYGQGAIGGIVNVITKKPVFGPTFYDALFSYGSYNTINSGIGVNTQIGEKVAVRLDLSRTSSSGYVHNDNPNSLNFTAAATIFVNDKLKVDLGLDVLNDSLPSYYGTPLVPTGSAVHPLHGLFTTTNGNFTIDESTRFANYNVSDSVHKSTTISPTALLTYAPAENVTITNLSYGFYAERRWQNAEAYTFLPAGSGAVDAAGTPIPANSIGRDRFYVYHQQHLYGDQLHLLIVNEIFSHTNRATVGVEGSYLQFIRSRGFPDATYADFVNPYALSQGQFGSFPGEFPQSQFPTHIADVAGMAEDALNITRHLKLVTGLRYEWLDLVRDNYRQDGSFNAATSFRSTYHPFNYRVGLVYDVSRDVSLYTQFTTAQDPPGSDIFLANRGQVNGLSSSQQEEIGLKMDYLDGRGAATAAVYNIERSNILTSTSNNTVANVGSQHAFGTELTADVRLTRDWIVNANFAFTQSRYGTFVDPNSGLNADGNKAPDVPTVSAGLFTVYSHAFRQPVDLGLGAHYVGERVGNYSNTLRLNPYELVDVFATWHARPGLDVTGRINNLFNKAYVQWADVNYPSEVLLGRPRYFEVALHVHL